jgi:hypothetical protein
MTVFAPRGGRISNGVCVCWPAALRIDKLKEGKKEKDAVH